MTLEVLNLIWLIHKVAFKEEVLNKIAFTTENCTRFTYVDNCLKNTLYSCIQKHRRVGNMLLLYFCSKGLPFMFHISIPLISSLTFVQIISYQLVIISFILNV